MDLDWPLERSPLPTMAMAITRGYGDHGYGYGYPRYGYGYGYPGYGYGYGYPGYFYGTAILAVLLAAATVRHDGNYGVTLPELAISLGNTDPAQPFFSWLAGHATYPPWIVSSMVPMKAAPTQRRVCAM